MVRHQHLHLTDGGDDGDDDDDVGIGGSDDGDDDYDDYRSTTAAAGPFHCQKIFFCQISWIFLHSYIFNLQLITIP